jgi:hypothetical protein
MTSDLGRIFGPHGRHYVESLDFVLLASLGLVLAIVAADFGRSADPPAAALAHAAWPDAAPD